LVWSAFDDAGPIVGTALKLILLLGQRPGEVSHLRFEHLRDGWWEMPGEPIPGVWSGTKNGSGHRVWIPKPASELLTEFAGEDTGYVFATVNGNAVGELDGAMRDICRKLNIERATPHDLRRTHGSTITKLGFGRDAMNRIQNHKEGGIADVYDRHSYENETKRVMEFTAAHLLALTRGDTAPSNVVSILA
jgi:integrase